MRPHASAGHRGSAGWRFERLAPQAYTPADWPVPLPAEVYRPVGAGRLPAVLVVHGGSWSGRSPADMSRICRHLAARGFVAVNVAYRLAPEHLYPAPVHDLQRALDWMVANATKLSIDPTRIGAFGYSAGAHLVSLLALRETGGAPYAGPARGQALRAVVAGGIPADLTRWPQSPVVRRFLGVSYRCDPQLWVEASPLAHVAPSAPPFFLYHGMLDRLVEVEQSLRMRQKLAAAGVPAELHTIPYHGHLSMFVLNRSALQRATVFLAEALNVAEQGPAAPVTRAREAPGSRQ
jgi:acetyl esterase/lipase